ELAIGLKPGDIVVLASDGLLEARAAPDRVGREPNQAASVDGALSAVHLASPSQAGEFFGFERLEGSVMSWAARRENASSILAGIWDDVTAWCDGGLQHDDVTLVVLRIPRSTVSTSLLPFTGKMR